MPETKKKVVPLSERETISTYNDAEKTANVYTMNRKLSRKLLAMAQALNEADVLRGDKIRRDVRNHGLPGHRRR